MAVQISGNDITVPRDGSFTRNVTIGGTLTYEDVTNIDSVGLVTARTGIEIGARPGVAASISVDGNMIVSGISTFNSRVLLGSTTEGASNADDLTVATSGHTGITIRSGTSNQGNIFFSDGTSGADEYRGYFQYEHTANALMVGTDGSERLRIDSSGRLQIGSSNNTSTGTKLVVGTGNNIAATAVINTQDTDVNALTLSNWDGSTTTNKLMMHFDSSGIGAFNIGMPAATDAFVIADGGTERVRIVANGAINLTSENTTGWQLDAGDNSASYTAIDNHFPTTNRTLYFNNETTHRSVAFWNKNGSDGYGFGLDNSGNFKVVYGTSERFRIASNGAIGLSGTNYGSSGQVLKSQGSGSAPVWGGAGLTSVSQWRLGTNTDIPAGSETVLPAGSDSWTEVSAFGYARLGSAMTQSGGVFTFPSTGIWRIEFTGFWGVGNSGSSNSLVTRIQVTENNSSYSNAHEQQNSVNSSSTYTYAGFYNTHMFDVTDTSTHKVRFTMYTAASNAYYKANSSPTMTGALFTRLGDT